MSPHGAVAVALPAHALSLPELGTASFSLRIRDQPHERAVHRPMPKLKKPSSDASSASPSRLLPVRTISKLALLEEPRCPQ